MLHLKKTKELVLLFDLIHPSLPQKIEKQNTKTQPCQTGRKWRREKKKKKSQITKVNHWLWAIYFTARWSVLCVDPPHLQNSFFTKEPKALPKLPCTHLFISHSPNLQPCIFNAQSEENNLPQVNQKQKDWNNSCQKRSGEQKALPRRERVSKDKRCHGSTNIWGPPANQIVPRGAICPTGGIWFHTSDRWISFFLGADGIWRSKPHWEVVNSIFPLWSICNYHECKHRERRIHHFCNNSHVFLTSHIADKKKQI